MSIKVLETWELRRLHGGRTGQSIALRAALADLAELLAALHHLNRMCDTATREKIEEAERRLSDAMLAAEDRLKHENKTYPAPLQSA